MVRLDIRFDDDSFDYRDQYSPSLRHPTEMYVHERSTGIDSIVFKFKIKKWSSDLVLCYQNFSWGVVWRTITEFHSTFTQQ